MALKVAYRSGDEFTAISIRDMLLQRGIGAMIQVYESQVFGWIFSGTMQQYWGDVRVEEADYERAIELIAGFQGTLGELEEAEEE